jgi:oxygen-independent coproporphyrinogen-3 oxidase
MVQQNGPFSLYLHIPFCTHRCGYCDFNTYAGLEELIPTYVEALRVEIASLSRSAGSRLAAHTIFLGGGTPSLLSIADLERIFQTLHDCFEIQPEAEITLEANPGTLSPEYLRDLRSLGVNRLSLGMQSAHPGELRLLERTHDYRDVIQAVTWARKAAFDNLNLDLIFGLPEQKLQAWQSSLELALGLSPEHFSLYALSLEHGTPLKRWASRGLVSAPDPDLAAEMYEWASQKLIQSGYAQYEISNWASSRSDESKGSNRLLACLHNMQYWRNLPYLGLGAGAHGYAAGVRTANVLSPQEYIRRLWKSEHRILENKFPITAATQSVQEIDQATEIGETMMMGLRLTLEGVPEAIFHARFGSSLKEAFAPQIERLRGLGLLEWIEAGPGWIAPRWIPASGDYSPTPPLLRLTERGRLLGNQVFVEFI